MFLGIFSTLLIPETKRKTLEELSGEEAAIHGGSDGMGGHGGVMVKEHSPESEGMPRAMEEGQEVGHEHRAM